MDVSVVIPSYNRQACIVSLLSDLRAQTLENFEIIVVDDCSPDDTVATIQREFPEVRLLLNENNSGPAVSRNRGFREARGRIIVGFDSDVTIPDRDLLSKVVFAYQNQPTINGYAFRVLEPDGITDDSPRWWHPKPCKTHSTKSFPTNYFSGTAYAFLKEPAIEAGLFTEIFYMHYEEVEFAWRFIDQKNILQYEPSFSVVHHANPVSRRSEIQMFYKPRNQVLLALRNFPTIHSVAYTLPRLGFHFLKSLQGLYFGKYLKALASAARLTPQCLRERRCLSSETLQLFRKLETSA